GTKGWDSICAQIDVVCEDARSTAITLNRRSCVDDQRAGTERVIASKCQRSGGKGGIPKIAIRTTQSKHSSGALGESGHVGIVNVTSQGDVLQACIDVYRRAAVFDSRTVVCRDAPSVVT